MKKTFSIDGNKDLMVLTLVYIESVNLGALFFRYAIILWDGSLHFLKKCLSTCNVQVVVLMSSITEYEMRLDRGVSPTYRVTGYTYIHH